MAKVPQKRAKPRAVTLTLNNDAQPVFLWGKRKLLLRNFSEEGIGLWASEPLPFDATRGNKIQGELAIGDQNYSVELEIAHRSENAVGLKILHRSPALGEILDLLLRPTTAASLLKPQARSGADDPEVGFPKIWYAHEDVELLVWFQPPQNMILGVQIRWMGKWIYRHQFRPIQTGSFIDDKSVSPGSRAVASDTVHVDAKIDQSFLAQCAQFLASVPHPLPGYLLWQFLETGEQVYLPANSMDMTDVA